MTMRQLAEDRIAARVHCRGLSLIMWAAVGLGVTMILAKFAMSFHLQRRAFITIAQLDGHVTTTECRPRILRAFLANEQMQLFDQVDSVDLSATRCDDH